MRFAGQLEALLATPLDAIVGGAFSAWRTLREYRDAKMHPPDEVALVPLLTHTIESTHHPYLEILIDGLPRRIPFEVRLALVIDGATLQVQAGRIREMRFGSCKGEGSLSCSAIVLVEPKTRSIPLPGVIRFPDGLPNHCRELIDSRSRISESRTLRRWTRNSPSRSRPCPRSW